MIMEIYLDNSSTTKPRDEVIEEMTFMLKTCYGNPSSLHRMGFDAEKKVKWARNIIADFLKIRSEELFFTSGGTESNNLAIQGIINKNLRCGNHIITSNIEHPSVLNIFKNYENRGLRVTYLDVDKDGIIDLDELEESIDDETILIALMLVNNEIGSIEPVEKVKKILTRKRSKAFFHVDGIQAFGKIPLHLKEWGIDSFSFSGHKIHGPKGIGGLYLNKDVILNPLIFGGGQERGIRSGTENVPGIVGMGKAVEILNNEFFETREKVMELKKYFIGRLKNEISDIKINSGVDERFSPFILNVSFMGIRGEVLLHYLEEKGIYISTGSACSSHSKEKSHVLKSIGLKDREVEGTVRFSFSAMNTKKDLDYTLDVLKDSLEEIRRITKR